MSDSVHAYHESLYQWIWDNLEFDVRGLKTACGQEITVFDQGELNSGAGPDFLRAHIRIGGIDWHGSVEIHKSERHWYDHSHHYDQNFNSVILHVIFEQPETEVRTENGSEPFTLNLFPYLNKKLRKLLTLKNSKSLPCGNSVRFINQKAFEEQIKNAHREYFNYKSEEVLEFYDSSLPVSEAWRNAFIICMYGCLGIPRNTGQMKLLASRLVLKSNSKLSARQLSRLAADKASSDIEWEHTGMRPASRPEVRIRQAAAIHAAVLNIPFKSFLTDGADVWDKLIARINRKNRPGKSRLSILKHTVFLPSLYLLGNLLHSRKIQKQSFEEWQSSHQKVPSEIIKPFQKAGFEIGKELKVMGLAHQYKRYCRENRCHKCKVFKNAIRS